MATATETISRKSIAMSAYAPLVALPIAVVLFAATLPAWIFMWLLALAVYAGLKWLTFAMRRTDVNGRGSVHALSYLLAWPGMDAEAFFAGERKVALPRPLEWATAITKTFLGGLLLWGVARFIPDEHWLVAGWIGMISLILIVHFGVFHLLSLLWRSARVDAKPLMNSPLAATTLADFWSNRWNLAFRDVARHFVFRPTVSRYGVAWATMAVFVVSGFVHDLVISLPARGGFGWPTLYFVAQGFALLLQRSRIGRRVGIDRGTLGRAFTLTVVLGGAVFLFHPPFVREVILPMMSALGAI